MDKSQNPLVTWLAGKSIKKREFAAKIGVTPGRVSQILKDGVAHLDLARRIEAGTGGEIPVDAWLEKPISAAPTQEAAQ